MQTASVQASGRASVDAAEISHFDGLASSWWDPHGPSRLLHLMNPLRHTFISSCLASQQDARDGNTDKLEILDVGCGGGIFAESAARLKSTAKVTAVDPSSDVLAIAKQHAKRDPSLVGRLEYVNIGVEDLPTLENGRDGGYDVVTLFEVLEHVTDPSTFLSILSAHVKPGGWLVLSTIARSWTSWMTTKLVAEDLLRIVPRGTHDWGKYVNEAELRQWFNRQGGWTSPRTMGVVYLPTLGWREVRGSEDWGNYFFAVRKASAMDPI